MRFGIIFFAALFFASVDSIPDKNKWEAFICRPNGVYTPNDSRVSDIIACGAGQCTYTCKATALGVINDDGTTSLEIYNEWVDARFPAEHKEVAKKHFADCYEKFGRHIDTADKQCVMSKAFTDCTFGVTPKLKCTYAA